MGIKKDQVGTVAAASPAVQTPPHVNWKADTPGNYYVGGDVVVAEPGDIIMADFSFDPSGSPPWPIASYLFVQMPSSNSVSDGKTVTIINIADKKTPPLYPGWPVFLPYPGESIGAGAVDERRWTSQSTQWQNTILVADGVGSWNATISSAQTGPPLSPTDPPLPP
jgi:hypothetical protein